MTYIVYDGKYVIADRMAQTETGGDLPGRAPVLADGSYPFTVAAKPVKVRYDDVVKLYTGKNYRYAKRMVDLIGFTGNTRNMTDMLFALDKGVSVEDFIKVEASCTPISERRIFTGDTSVFALMDDGEAYIFHKNSKGIAHKTSTTFTHLGSGMDIVDPIMSLMPDADGHNTKLTALEAFVIAAGHCDSVGRVFDYYCIKTKKMHYDNKLTGRQMKLILGKLQKRINLKAIYGEDKFINRG